MPYMCALSLLCNWLSSQHLDVEYLYKNVILDYHDSEWIEKAVGIVIDSKHFVKEGPFVDEPDQLRRFICRVLGL